MRGFLRSLKQALAPPSAPSSEIPNCSRDDGRFDLEVVGESFYQDELRWCLRKAREDREVIVRVMAEPSNKHDPNAVVIQSSRGRPVGYLPRELAWIVQPPLLKYTREHGAVRCRGRLAGGTIGAPTIGIWLDLDVERLGVPAYQLAESTRDVRNPR